VLPLVAVGVVGALVRVAYTVVLGQDAELGISDASFYTAAANLLADGEGFVDLFRSFEEGEGALLRTAHHPPGWPALLSIASSLGVEDELGHRLVGAVLGGVVVVAVGLVARRLAGPTAGIVAAVVAALHPTLVAADGSLMSETLAGLLVLASLLAALEVLRTGRTAWAVGLGAAIGLGALVRGEALLYLPLLVVPLAVLAARRSGGWRSFLRVAGVAGATAAVVVAPWTIRNLVVMDDLVLISTNDSTVLAGANCESAYEGPLAGGWDLGCIERLGGSEVEDAAIWREQGLEFIGDNLDRLPVVVGIRIARTWGIHDLSPVAEGRDPGVQRAGNVVWLALLLPVGVAGAVVLARRGRGDELVVLLSPVAAATAVTVLGFGMLRFRHPMELVAAVLAGVVAAALVDRARGRRSVASAGPAVVGS